MMDFNEVKYIAGIHSRERIVERLPGTTEEYARGIVEAIAHEGIVLLEYNDYRYIKNDNFFLPCIKIAPKTYFIKTVLHWTMVEKGDGLGLQREIDKFSKGAH